MPPAPSNRPLADEGLSAEPEVRSLARSWLLVVVWIMGLYLLSPAPIIWGLQKVGGRAAGTKTDLLYAPIVFLYRNVPFVRVFYDWQFDAIGIRP